MMRDIVALRVNNQEISNFQSYSIEADLYTAADGFTLELSDPLLPVTAGSVVELYINGARELIGTIDARKPYNDKRGSRLTLTGRDVCGWLVDAHCEEFITLQGVTLQALAQRLLKNAPAFVTLAGIIYQQNLIGNLKRKKAKTGSPAPILWAQDGGQAYATIQPGQSVFEVLKTYAASRGMMFYALPDGTLVFGAPLAGGAPIYYLTRRKDNAAGNNIEAGGLDEDISKRYSKITVIGQRQGTNADVYNSQGGGGPALINTGAGTPIFDPTFPFYKPFVAVDNNDSRSPALHAQMLLQKMRAEGYTFNYTVAGHSQNGQNWQINQMCHVNDQAIGMEGDFLIYGRTFARSKEQGTITHLRLGYPGIVE